MKSIAYTSLIAILTLLGTTSNASAALLASDDFESYALGSTVAGNNGGTGFSGAWGSSNAGASANTTILSSSLSYSGGTVFANGGSQAAQYVAGTGAIFDGHLTRSIPFGGSGSDPIYMSYLWNNSVNNDAPASGDDFAQFGFDGTPDNPQNSIMQRNGLFQARSSTSTAASNGSVPVNIDQTYLLVMKAEDTGSGFYDQVTLWVDPLSDVEGAETVDGISTGVGAMNTGNIASIALRSAFWESDDTFLVDNILIGESFADVVPTAVPEPASIVVWSLLGLCLAGYGYRRRRNC